jgi:hypothetical protein
MINSTRRLVLRQGGFTSDQHVDPTTGQPPPEIEGPPNPLIYRPGIYLVIAGLVLQIADVIISEYFKIDI